MIMNNEYDREPLTETIEIQAESGEAAVKLLVMHSGATVIAEVTEHMYGDYYTVHDPRTVSLEIGQQDGKEVIESISYAGWMPLSSDSTFQIAKSAVVSVCNPIESLAMSYKGATING